MINRTTSSYWCIMIFLLCCSVVDALGKGNSINKVNHFKNQLTVKGKVSDANGALPGVIVKLKGSTNSTSTEGNGNYSLTIPDGTGTLVFSSIGYISQEIAVENRSVINVTLVAENKTLSEIIVVGYGTQRKSDITGSIVSINEKSLKEVPVANLSQALQGKAAGIDVQKGGGNSKPGSAPVIRIRGVRSISAENGPLFVVDGIPYNGNINDFNPDDVASIEVLKDASATAIYGARGANGVILVTSKRGKVGEPVVSYSGYAGVTKNLGKINVMNGEEYMNLKKWAVVNGNFVGTTPKYTGIDDPRILTDGIFAAEEIEGINTGRSTDWQDLIYKSGLNTNHQVSVSGGSEKTQYAVSAGYHNETGIYPGQAFARYTVKAGFDQQLGKRVKIGLSSLNTYNDTEGENANPMGQVLRASPLASPYDKDGKLLGFVPGSANQVWNPLADFVDGAKVENRKRFGTFTTLYGELSIADGLKYKFNGGVELKSDNYGNFYGSATSNNLGGLSTSNNRSAFRSNFTLENILTYDKVIAQNHKINFTGLFSYQEAYGQSNSFSNNDTPAELVYYNPAFGSNLVGTGDYEKWGIVSYMGRLNYGFKDKYLLTLTMRSDGSSRLSPGKKYQSFPSVAVAWNMQNESFLRDVKAVSSLKIRASYGRTGNTAIDPYQTLGALGAVPYNFGDQTTTGAYLVSVVNKDLRWEHTTTTDIGVDFGFFNNRLVGTVEVYRQLTDKLLLTKALPLTQGIPNSPVSNVGKTENNGLEFQLSTVNFKGDGKKEFSWTTDANVFLNRGKITALDQGAINDITNSRFVGEPIGTIFDYRKIGIWQNTPEDIALAKSLGLTVTGSGSVIGNIKVENANTTPNANGDQRITADDRVILGSSQPDWSGGLTNRFGYKNFDFTVVAFGRFGSTIISRVHNSGFANTFQGNYNNLNVHYWTPTNGENFWPKPNAASTNTPNNSTLGYFDGTFVKIRSLTLGYNLPSSVVGKIGGKSLRVYATANDAFILFSKYRNKYSGIDPEAINAGNNRGEVNVDTPATYSLIFGVSLTL
ncbi:SusC/RagA family TonB-linked outer membrane protein [Pedobacter hiemivivus]|uniref:TonB-dependent receptor n=1 Tax=Pedobacter hiemivivus TaxID=2530454 RepID=A0A4R0MPK7_9SPHI|nr:TonB-dependent receptor [Pedobacter hiemivivus]TCC88457.1 TonB-dependent receptor [Pedobacter hiemivivus]